MSLAVITPTSSSTHSPISCTPTRDGLYHKSTGLPELPEELTGLYGLFHTRHATMAAKTDAFAGPGGLRLPGVVEVCPDEVIEIEIKDQTIEKVVVRTRFADRIDVVYVLTRFDPSTRVCNLRTVWCIPSNDHHAALRTERYARL